MNTPDNILTPQSFETDRRPRAPMLWAVTAFACGVVLGAHAWRPAVWWIMASVSFVAAALYLARFRLAIPRALALVAIVFLGALDIQVRPPDFAGNEALRFADGREVQVIAHVVHEGDAHKGAASSPKQIARQSLDVETEEIVDGTIREPLTALVRLSLYEKSTPQTSESQNSPRIPDLRYGTRLRFTAKLHPPRNFRNPGAFDYEGYLHSKGIVVLASAKCELLDVLPGFAGSRVESLRERLHRSVIDHVHQLWPAPDAALIDAMVIGEDAFIERDTRVNFQRSGTYHILVVSGMNLGILVVVVFWCLRHLRLRELTVSIVAILVAISYVFLTDAGAPIWRATLMLMLYLATRYFYRDRCMLNAIGVAAFGLLIVDPRSLFSTSFQLTFLAVLVIAAIAVPILERVTQPYLRGLCSLDAVSYDPKLPPRVTQVRLDLRLLASRIKPIGRFALPAFALAARAILGTFELLFVSALMQAGLALPMAFYFHRATLTGLPANLAAVPLTAVLMPFAAAAITLSYISLLVSKPFAWMAQAALRGITSAVGVLGSAQLADIRVPTPATAVIVATAAALLIAAFTARKRMVLAITGLACLALASFWITAVSPKPRIRSNVLEVTAIDVGQGDSALIISPDGHTLLVDAGGLPHWMHSDFDIGEEVVSSYLWSRGIQRLDAVAVTHAHADHMGGMSSILQNFRPKELWLGVDTGADDLRKLLDRARSLNIAVVLHHAGDEFQFGGAGVRILAPERDPTTQTWRANDDSLVMKISYQKTSVLMEGDAERVVEERIVRESPEATLLKVAHHGSATSTSRHLLDAVHPQYAIISVGFRNGYGHPRQEVLQRLRMVHVATYRTDINGAVTFYLDGSGVTPLVPALR